jgi:hypothetical protein
MRETAVQEKEWGNGVLQLKGQRTGYSCSLGELEPRQLNREPIEPIHPSDWHRRAELHELLARQPVSAREVVGAVRSPVYAFLNAHNGLDCSRCDDLIRWFYLVLALSQFRLPWLRLEDPRDEIVRQKTEYPWTRLAKPMSAGFQTPVADIERLAFAPRLIIDSCTGSRGEICRPSGCHLNGWIWRRMEG